MFRKFAFIEITSIMDYKVANIFETCRGKSSISINNFKISK